MSMTRAFRPINTSTVSLSVTSTSSSTTLGNNGETILLTNSGTNRAYVRYGNGDQTAVTTDMVVLGGQQIVVSRDDGSTGDTTIAAICQSGETTTLEATLGYGE